MLIILKQALKILHICKCPEGVQRRPWAQEKVENKFQNNFSAENTPESILQIENSKQYQTLQYIGLKRSTHPTNSKKVLFVIFGCEDKIL